MPELSYLFNDEEMEDFVTFLLGLGMSITPSRYVMNQPPMFDRKDDVIEYVREKDEALWHLSREDFTKFPLEQEYIKAGHYQGNFSIVQRIGGSTIDLSWAGDRVSGGVKFIREGCVDFYPTFFDPRTREKIRAPDEQRTAYQQITRWVRDHSVPSKLLISDRTGRLWPSIRIGKKAAIAWTKGVYLGPPSNVSREPSKTPRG